MNLSGSDFIRNHDDDDDDENHVSSNTEASGSGILENINLKDTEDNGLNISGSDSEIEHYLNKSSDSESNSPITIITKKFQKKKKSHSKSILLTKTKNFINSSAGSGSDTESLIPSSKLQESTSSLTKRKSEDEVNTNNSGNGENLNSNINNLKEENLSTNLLSLENSDSNNHHNHNHHDEDDEDNCEIDNKIKHTFALTDYKRLPSYLQGNEFIQTGYRVNFSFKLCATSIFKIHNETINIWTHLLGTIGFFILMIYTQVVVLSDSDPIDKFIFTIFFFGAICQMLFSTLFHTFCSVSPLTYLWFARLDYTGISLMIVGSYFPVLYYIFKCVQPLATLYITGISILGVVGVIVGMLPVFQSYRFRTFRAVFFIIFGFYIIIPLPHLWVIKGFDYFWPVLWRLMGMGSIYISGATIYSTRCPECCAPGKFDNGWSSHAIWHVFCIVAALTQYYVCIYSYRNFGSLC